MLCPRWAGPLACLVLTACTSLSLDPSASDVRRELQYNARQDELDAARIGRDRRRDALVVARQAAARAEAGALLARADLNLADARVTQAEARVAVAETGSPQELGLAVEALLQARVDAAPQRELTRWHDLYATHCQKAVTLAGCEQELAEARVSLLKARTQDRDVASHEEQVSKGLEQTARAGAELQVATRECCLAQRAYDEARGGSRRN